MDNLEFPKHMIAVVIPAFKVQDQISKVVENIPAWVKLIIVVNDASPDDTAKILKKIKNPRLHIIHHDTNQGVGGAMLSGYALAFQLGAEVAVKMDGDDQMDPSYLPALITPVLHGEADYVKGNRFLHTTALLENALPSKVGKCCAHIFYQNRFRVLGHFRSHQWLHRIR